MYMHIPLLCSSDQHLDLQLKPASWERLRVASAQTDFISHSLYCSFTGVSIGAHFADERMQALSSVQYNKTFTIKGHFAEMT